MFTVGDQNVSKSLNWFVCFLPRSNSFQRARASSDIAVDIVFNNVGFHVEARPIACGKTVNLWLASNRSSRQH